MNRALIWVWALLRDCEASFTDAGAVLVVVSRGGFTGAFSTTLTGRPRPRDLYRQLEFQLRHKLRSIGKCEELGYVPEHLL